MSMMVQSGRFGAGGGVPTVTWNPLDKSGTMDLTSGNLVVTRSLSGFGLRSVRATRGIPHTGNGYFEVMLTSDLVSPFDTYGVCTGAMDFEIAVGQDALGWGYYEQTGQKYTNNTLSTYGSQWDTNGIVLGCAFNNGSVWFSRAGVWQNSGDPAAGTGAAFTGITGTIYPGASLYRGGVAFTGRFKLADFTYTPPTGFDPWGT